ncbi:GNAT family N-acetyltransferase [Streptomyces mirabilis]|jgi:GNAT superfamily N-acetyltransferase|uniref:GNAT family N-acetyltransferase n=1 Tax=Streptomyces mirabilis TaxID=68239 RepID=UPI002258C853|nr:GNAT family N-acetyltransferase [Streptomyces mirabilis]MCX4434440.1 GNAT family N-acetyltransferase [Streptomyces mirabilis]
MSDERHEVIVRRAEQADIKGLVACSSALFAEDAGTRDPGVDINWPREHGPQRFASGLADPNRLLLVVDRDGGEVVGHLTGTLVKPSAMRPMKVATLVSMYVRPAYRRDRIGRRMVDEFRSWAKESGAGSAQVTAYASNAEAIRFYERNGFASQSVTLEAAL